MKQDFLNILRLFPDYEKEILRIASKRHKKNIKCYKKSQELLQISKNSIFWSLKRCKSLYEIVRLRRLPADFYFLDPNSLFPHKTGYKKRALLPSRHFFSNLLRFRLSKKRREEPLSLLSLTNRNEFELITGLYEKVIDNTYELQKDSVKKSRKSSKTSNLMKEFLRQESKRSPRHNQVVPLKKELSLRESEESATPYRKKSLFTGFKLNEIGNNNRENAEKIENLGEENREKAENTQKNEIPQLREDEIHEIQAPNEENLLKTLAVSQEKLHKSYPFLAVSEQYSNENSSNHDVFVRNEGFFDEFDENREIIPEIIRRKPRKEFSAVSISHFSRIQGDLAQNLENSLKSQLEKQQKLEETFEFFAGSFAKIKENYMKMYKENQELRQKLKEIEENR